MKKVLNKALAFIMAAALCVGMCATALAATPSATDTGTITISGLESGLTVNAYKIAEAEYDSSGQFTGYKMLYTVTDGFSINSDGSYDSTKLTEANLAALYTAAQARGVTNSAASNNEGVASFQNMPVGSYLFVVTGAESTVYGMVIGSVSYVVDAETNEWSVKGGTVDVLGSNSWVKAATPKIKKEETGGSLDDYEHGGSADLGDTLEYHITVGPIPSYEGEYPEFKVTDEISSDLTITDAELSQLTVTVIWSDTHATYVVLQKDTDYTVERTESGFTVDFVVDGKYTLNTYAGQSLLIDFSADVTSVGSTDVDDDDHSNKAELDFSTTSYVFGQEGKTDDTDHDYTFNAKIMKTDGTNAPLAGAKFSLYTDETCSTAYTQNGTAVTATSASDGYFEFTGLEEGTYYMKETEAPAGYALNTNIYKIVITATYGEDGTLDTFTITVYDTTNGNVSVGSAVVTNPTATISNTKTGELPSMGGTGITLCVIAGCVVIAAAVCGVVVYRRRNAG